MKMLLKHSLIFVPSVVNVHALMLCYFKHFGECALSTLLGAHILSQVSYAHSDTHPPCTLITDIRYPVSINLMPDIHQRALMFQPWVTREEVLHTIFFQLFFHFFLNITMARKLTQIDQIIDHIGAYFQEEMWQIVSLSILEFQLVFSF